jgi:hypothetical protein
LVARWHRGTKRRVENAIFSVSLGGDRRGPGVPKFAGEHRELIQRMAIENPPWAAPRSHRELLKLVFEVSERTAPRHLARVRRKGDARRRWLIVLNDHILDRDRKYKGDITELIECMNPEPIGAACRSPWQNGVVERWGELPQGFAGPRDRVQRSPLAEVGSRIPPRLSCG